MENASKALLIAGAILLCILIIAIGMFIYNGAQSTVTESMTTMSTQEIESFNNQFMYYEGEQTGTNLKALMGRLIANANTYKDESTRLPYVYIELSKSTGESEHAMAQDDGNQSNYIAALGRARNKIKANHKYWVEMSFQKNGLIDYIMISYDKSVLLPSKNRDGSSGALPPV